MHIAVIGLGSFGQSVAKAFMELGGEVLAIDHDEALVEALKDSVTQSIAADATNERTLRAIGVTEVDTAVVSIGALGPSVMTTMLLRRMGLSRIVARAINEIHAAVLQEVGASRVISLEEQMGLQVAKTLIAPHILDRRPFAEGFSLVEVRAPHSLVGKTLRETNLRNEHRLNVVALQNRKSEINEEGRSIFKVLTSVVPEPEQKIEEGHILVMAGADSDIDAFLKGGF